VSEHEKGKRGCAADAKNELYHCLLAAPISGKSRHNQLIILTTSDDQTPLHIISAD
jgi:hypothetical protein